MANRFQGFTKFDLIKELKKLTPIFNTEDFKTWKKQEVIDMIDEVEQSQYKEHLKLFKRVLKINPNVRWEESDERMRQIIEDAKQQRADRKYAKKQAKQAKVERIKAVIEEKQRAVREREAQEEKAVADQVVSFQRSNTSQLEIRNLNERTFRAALRAIVFRPDYYVTLEAGDRFMPLNQTNVARLTSLAFEVQGQTESESDKVMIGEVKRNDVLILTQIPKSVADAAKLNGRIRKYKARESNERAGGAFFKYINKTKMNLERYGVYKTLNKNDHVDNCLIHAVRMSGRFTEAKLTELKLKVVDRHIPANKLDQVARILDVYIVLKKMKSANVAEYGDESRPQFDLGLIDNHYFLIEKTIYNSYAIKHYNEVKDRERWWLFESDTKRKALPIDSYKVIKIALENKLFEPMVMNSDNILQTQYYDSVEQELTTLDYYPPANIREVAKSLLKGYSKIYYADFETFTNTKHEAYLSCVITDDQEWVFDLYGNPGAELLEVLKDGSVCYFHNLGYDVSFFVKYLNTRNIIKTGSMVKMITGSFKGKRLTFKDSYAMISEPLSKFTKMFDIPTKKEIMPYGLYTARAMDNTTASIADALTFLAPADHREFLELVEPYRDGEEFRHLEYAKFYCLQDCRVLKQGMEKFRGWIREAFELDCVAFVSLPSLAHRYLAEQGCFDGVVQMSGVPQIFIQRCVKGGRCMTRDNTKWHITKKFVEQMRNREVIREERKEECILNDFDAVSLYPSAMERMPGFLKGSPKVIPEDMLCYDFLKHQSGYFVEIKNVQINEPLHFPLQSEKNEKGIRNYTNEFTKNLYIDKVGLEDLIRFQGATFDVVRGYYFDEGHNDRIKAVMKYCFEQRVQKKKEKNAIETVYKLLMNAAYGKLIQKPIKTDLKFTNTQAQHEKFVGYNYNFIKEYSQLCPGKYVYSVQRSICDHFNMAHVGTEILSMSKRIMNEVMCLAEDLNINIYYQDTDSMHIENSQIKLLADEFRRIYGRELIGEAMGQFHSDFSAVDPTTKKKINADLLVSTESYFLGKKAYIDQIECTDPNINVKTHHIRMKGVSDDAIKRMDVNGVKNDPMFLYKHLYNGNSYEFKFISDEAGAKPRFKRNKDFSYETLVSFNRSVKF
jgi:hypothetical protein